MWKLLSKQLQFYYRGALPAGILGHACQDYHNTISRTVIPNREAGGTCCAAFGVGDTALGLTAVGGCACE